MKWLDSHTVEFTSAAEIAARDRFDLALDEGLDIIQAASMALEVGLACGARYSAEFVEYLSEDTVFVTSGRKVLLTIKGKRLTEEAKA